MTQDVTFLRLGDLVVSVGSTSDDVRSRFLRLYSSPESSDRRPAAHLEIMRDGDSWKIELTRRGTVVRRFQNLASAMQGAVSELNRLYLDHHRDRLHLHAGAVVDDFGRPLLLIGSSGSGKSTLVASCLSAGFSYGTDELVGVGEGLDLHVLNKPIKLRSGGALLVDEFRADGRPVPDLLAPVDSLGPRWANWPLPPHALVVIDPPAGESCDVAVLPTHEAVVSIVANTGDFARLGAEAFRRSVALAARSNCYKMRLGPVSENIASVESIAAQPASARSAPAIESVVAPNQPTRTVRLAQFDEGHVLVDVDKGTLYAANGEFASSEDTWARLREHGFLT